MKWFSYPVGIVAGLMVMLAVVAWGVHAAAEPSGATYIDPSHRFALEVPRGSTVKDFPSDNGVETLIVDDGSSGDVQVTITKRDALPDYSGDPMQNSEAVEVAGASGVAFVDSNGQSQLLFVHGGYLYEMTGFQRSIDTLKALASSMRFN